MHKKYYRTPVPDLYEVIVAALGRNSGKILAQTTLSITVLGTPQVKKVFDKTVYERTVDRGDFLSFRKVLGKHRYLRVKIDKKTTPVFKNQRYVPPYATKGITRLQRYTLIA